MAQAFTCPNCSAPLDYSGQDLTVRCPYCNSSVIVPDSLRTGPSTPVPASRQPSLPVVGLDSLTSQALQLKEVAQQIRSGNKIQAIKIYRETFNVGLAEAKDAVEALAAGRPIVMPGSAGFTTTQSSFSPGGGGTSSDPLEDRVAQLLRGGNKIEAIKIYREAYGVGLKEAKDAVETYERGFPLPKPATPFQPYAGSQPAIPTFNSGTASPAPTYTATTSGTYSNQPKGGSFIGTWFGWSFAAFWVGFITAMLSLFAFPGVLRLAAPVFCPEDYVDAYGQRVFNYYDADSSTSVDGAGLLMCVSPDGTVSVIHPLLTFAFMFIVPWVLGIGVALWLAIFRNVAALGCLAAGAETVAILVGIVVLNFNIPAPSSQTIPMFLFGPEAVSGSTITSTTTITSTQTFTFESATATPSFGPLLLTIGGEEGTEPSQFNDTRTIAVDGDGNIYAADYSDGRIQSFAPDGTFLSMFDIEDDNVYITGIAAAEDGRLFVVYGGDLHVYDGQTGEELPSFTSSRAFNAFADVAVSTNGDIVAASSDEIVVYGSDGTEKLVVQDWADDLSEADSPDVDVDNLAIDRSGNIYISDRDQNQIFKFSPEGTFMDRIGVGGDEPNEFDNLYGIAVDSENRIYGVDYDGVKVFNARGAFLGLIEIGQLSFDITVHEDRLYVMDRNSNEILVYQQP